jgi:hypothetical protein
MICTSEPICSDGAVQSKPMYPVIGPLAASASSTSGSDTWWIKPRLCSTFRKSDLKVDIASDLGKGVV